MTLQQLRKAHQSKPFKPFSLRTAGREHHVPHPEFLWILPGGRTIAVADADGAAEIIDLLLVESLHFAGSRGSNGRRR